MAYGSPLSCAPASHDSEPLHQNRARQETAARYAARVRSLNPSGSLIKAPLSSPDPIVSGPTSSRMAQTDALLARTIIVPRPVSTSDVTSITSIADSTHDIHTGKTWAASVSRLHGTEDAWLPLILTLDGGGIRGYSSLLILEELMKQIAHWENKFERISNKPAAERKTWKMENLQPCLYFDFMYGTSTGGLIATMLGRLRMTVPQCLKIYKRVGNDLFGVRRSSIPFATKYKHEPLQKAVIEIVQQNCPRRHQHSGDCKGVDWHPWHLDDEGDEPAYLEPYGKDTADRLCHR